MYFGVYAYFFDRHFAKEENKTTKMRWARGGGGRGWKGGAKLRNIDCCLTRYRITLGALTAGWSTSGFGRFRAVFRVAVFPQIQGGRFPAVFSVAVFPRFQGGRFPTVFRVVVLPLFSRWSFSRCSVQGGPFPAAFKGARWRQ